ncbi:MarR family transcriptional regulator [Blastococcus sp. KM273128]|uniref:MarR family winged helix-turn-helix transcriptional regulator n=1 Tax=Blastococcus sp. KM273128 TaxID=2570314 RepID=UPI001F3D45CF|nr:MarR family transcriptional regulator [Blastococcus sp. KM273128]MCF6744060.1 MarR family transcriptional regulator [Blastococcus sp. KM273128]
MRREQVEALNGAVRTIAIRHRALAGELFSRLGLHPGQEVVLFDLYASGPRTQGQLAVAAGCEPSTITVSARKLEAAGLITRRPSPTDARATIVELSDAGRELVPELQAAYDELAERSVAGLTSVPVDELVAVLTAFAQSLQASDRAPLRS